MPGQARPPRNHAAQQNSRASGKKRSASGSAQRSQRSGERSRAGAKNRPPAARSAAASRGPSRRPVAANGRRPQGAAARPAQNGKRPPARRRPPKRRLRWGRIFAVLAALLVLVVLAVWAKDTLQEKTAAETPVVQSVTEPLVSDADKAGFDASINSDSAILINADNGDVLYEKDADAQRAPASLTKMMTVYVAIRNNENLDRELEMPDAAFEGLEENKASQSGLEAGETVTIRDLLYAALLKSGGDAANALALATSGNINGFVSLMNEEAKALGMDSTTFTNPTGLDDADQVSTCRDMARLLKGALGNNTFREIFTSREYTTTPNETHKDGLLLTSTMDDDLTSFQRYFDTSGYEIVGGKTGYTQAAGNCLASLAEKTGQPDYIVVTMHATGTGDQYYQAVHDAVTLYGEAYERDGANIESNDAKS